jgi:hypothetical protein
MKRAGIREFDASRIAQARSSGEWFKLQFLGPLPKFLQLLGPVLAAGVIAFVALVIVGGVGAIVVVRMWK